MISTFTTHGHQLRRYHDVHGHRSESAVGHRRFFPSRWKVSQHNRTPLQSKRSLLDDHVYDIMAIISAEIMTYTASVLKAQLDIFTFVHPVDGNIHNLLVPVEDTGVGERVKLPHRLPHLPKYSRNLAKCGTVGHRLSAQSEFDHQYATIQYPQRSTSGVKSSTPTTPQKQSRLPHNR